MDGIALVNQKTETGFRVKVKVKVKFTLQQATKAQRGRRCTDLLFL